MLKSLKSLFVGALMAIGLGSATVAVADTSITPLVGYQFQTKNVVNKQTDTMGSYQKNHATYGLQVLTDVSNGYGVGAEYLRTDSNYDSYQLGIIGEKSLLKTDKDSLYALGGVGYSKIHGLDKNQEGAYFALGTGYKKQLTNLIAVKGEVRANYLSNNNQWIPTALVGFEFNTSEFGKPYSR